MPYNLDYYTPLPPRRPDTFGTEDRNALAQMLDPKQIWRQRYMDAVRNGIQPGSMLGIRARSDDSVPMSSFLGGQDPTGMQGPPMPDESMMNYLRALLGYR